MEDYIYSSTYLRTIEKWLLDATDIQRMVGAKDARETLRVLEDTNYAKEFKGLISKTEPADYRKILRDDIESAKRLIYFLTKNKTLIRFLLLFFDFHNLKLFFREKILNQNLDEFISLHGSENPEELKRAVFGEKAAKIDKEFQKVIERANEKFKENPEPFFIDSYLDKERIALSLLLAKKMKNDWILNYVKRKVDLLNLENLMRIFQLKRMEKIRDVLVKGGNVEWDLMLLAKCADSKDVI
jgi:V/A-type H+-transporting ATPase subunit C